MTPLAVTFYDSMTAVHIMTVVAAFGVLLAAPVVGPEVIHGRAVWIRLLSVASVLTLLTGAYLATESDAWSEVWVTVPMTILFVVVGLVHAVIVPAERAMADGDAGARSRWRGATTIGAVLVLIAIFFMTTKLGG